MQTINNHVHDILCMQPLCRISSYDIISVATVSVRQGKSAIDEYNVATLSLLVAT